MSLAFSEILAAAERLRGVAHLTPVITSRTLDERTGRQVFLKCENQQRAGAFKFRGAYNAIVALPAEQRARGVLAYSSGNHAQGTALAAQLLGIPAVIVMPQDAPAVKVAATRGYGAEVIFYDRFTEDRERIARSVAADRGMSLIPPYDSLMVMAGQGTAALELLDAVPDLDTLVAPISGGGLLGGTAVAAHGRDPQIQIYGVEPAAADDLAAVPAARRAGHDQPAGHDRGRAARGDPRRGDIPRAPGARPRDRDGQRGGDHGGGELRADPAEDGARAERRGGAGGAAVR